MTPQLPPSLSNKIAPIIVYQNYYTETNIPNDLFSSDLNPNEIVAYKSTDWIDDNKIKVATRLTQNQDNLTSTLFVKAYDSGTWKISIQNYGNALFKILN